MRTAEDIVNEYRRRKYDTFRIRAIAALRPEPMRGQILALLDAEETAEAAFEEVGAEVMVDAPVSATLDVMSDVLAEEIDLIDEIEEVAEAEPVAMNLVEEDAEEELEPAMAASSTLFSAMASAPRAKDLAVRAAQKTRIELAEILTGSDQPSSRMVAETASNDEQIEEDILTDEEEGDGDLFTVLAEASEEGDEEESDYEEVEYEDDEQEEASEYEEVDDENEEEDSEYEEVEEEDEEEVAIALPEEIIETEQEAAQGQKAAISMEDDATAYLEQEADNKILFMFHDEGKAKADNLAQGELHLVEEGKEDSEWYDYGAGLIVVPKSMHEVQEAYTRAMQSADLDSEEVLETSLDDLVEAFENEDSLDEFDGQKPASGEEWQTPAATSRDDYTDEELRIEISELETSIANIEKRLRTAQEDGDKRSQLLVEAEDLVALQQSELEELLSEVAQRDATIRELEASLDGMHEFNSEAVIRRAQTAELERERNILKTDVIPALEDQQLMLVDLLEEETREHNINKKHLRGMRRRMLVGYSAAVVACLFSVSLAFLNKYPLPGMEVSNPGNLQLVASTEDGLVAEQSERLAALNRDNEMLRAALSKKEAEWKHTEGSLRRLIAAKEEELATRHTELRNRLTAMQSERDRTLHQYALVQTRQDTSPTPAPRAGAVVTPVASVASEQVRVATYEVKPGDDLGTIYKKHFGGPIKWPLVKKIAEKNGLASPNDIHPGQILNLAMIEVE